MWRTSSYRSLKTCWPCWDIGESLRASQGRKEYSPRDRGGDGATGGLVDSGLVLHDDGDGHLRIVGGGEGDEPGVDGVEAGLGRSRLAGDLDLGKPGCAPRA